MICLKNLQRTLFPRCISNLIPARFMLCIFVFLGCFNIYTLRVALNVAIVTMTDTSTEDHFKWDTKDKALIISAFYYGYIPMNFFGGRFSELFGGKKVFGIGVILTTILTLLTPLAADFGIYAIVALRVIEGIFEGISVPATYTIYGRWFPKSERSFLRTLCEVGFDMGYILGNPLTGFLCSCQRIGGWRSVFYIFGVAGIVWYIFWCIMIYETPEDHPFISEKELEYILKDQGDESAYKKPPIPWCSILTSVPLWALNISSIISGLIIQVIREDFNIFLKDVMNYDITSNGLWSALPYAIDLPVSLISGYVGDRLIIRYPRRRTFIRKAFSTFSNGISILSLVGVVLVGHNPVAIILLLSISYGLVGMDTAAGSGGFLVDMSPVFAGSIYGILNGLGNINGIVAPEVVGHITNGRESSLKTWYLVFYIAIATGVIAQVIILVFCTSEIQSWGLVKEDGRLRSKPWTKIQHFFGRKRFSLSQNPDVILTERGTYFPEYINNQETNVAEKNVDISVSSEGIQP